MLKSGEYPLHSQDDGFPARLRQVIDSYGSTTALARVIDRSEGAVRKWLRGKSEPNVSDLRAICDATGTSAEWLVTGRGDRQRVLGVRESRTPYGAEPELPPLNYTLMDDVVHALRADTQVLGTHVAAEKQSSMLTTVYNMSCRSRQVDREAVIRIAGLMS